MADGNRTQSRLVRSALFALVFCLCLCVVSFALAATEVKVEENIFITGTVDINLNNGEPVIREDEYLFEPGMTVEKDFFLQNDSTDAVFYRLYMENVTGGLADVLEIEIREGETPIVSGTAKDLTDLDGLQMAGRLELRERKDLTIRFHYPESAGNDTQDETLQFTLCAEAVQTRNNPEAEFGA